MFPRKTVRTKINSGAAAEHAAAAWLLTHGLSCLERNFRCRGGEIDLVMRDQETLVFVEVRLRNRSDFGSAIESVTATKQRRIIHAAQYYLATHPSYANIACRFDVLAAKHENEAIEWEWIRDAFCAG